MTVPGERLNWCAASPDGSGILIGWNPSGPGKQCGVEYYDRAGKFIRQIYQAGAHGDTVLVGDRWAYLTVALDTSDPQLHWLDGAKPTKLLSNWAWGSWWHVSGQGPANVALVNGYALADNPDFAYVGKNEIYLLDLQNPGHFKRLIHHRTLVGSDYYAEPHATISPSGRLIAWNENFGDATNHWTAVAQIR
jgi:hypothetical protein